jgi:hypothetical protein
MVRIHDHAILGTENMVRFVGRLVATRRSPTNDKDSLL